MVSSWAEQLLFEYGTCDLLIDKDDEICDVTDPEQNPRESGDEEMNLTSGCPGTPEQGNGHNRYRRQRDPELVFG